MRNLAVSSAFVMFGLIAMPSLSAIDLDVTTQDVERALSIARGPDRDRARFHAPYIQTLTTLGVDSVEVVSEFRRYVLTAEDRIRQGDRVFGFSSSLAQQALAPWKTRVAIVARLRFHPQNNYITIPPAEIALEGNERALVGVRTDPILALPLPDPTVGTPVLGAVVEGVFDALAVGQGVREFVVRLARKELARVRFDLSALD